MKSTVVINIAGLSHNLSHRLKSLQGIANNGSYRKIEPVLPALTCSTQSTYLTGLSPSQHGIVGNGWYFEDLSQICLWEQSNHLVQGKKVWDLARERNAAFTSANLFWWYNMYSTVNTSVTPRPIYRANGLKLPDIYTEPASLQEHLEEKLGPFPLYNFWGPSANISSTRWISEASQIVYQLTHPTLLLVYLPHLDYCLQKEGPLGHSIENELKLLDQVCANLLGFFQDNSVTTIVLSEYGITPVDGVIPINQALRKSGWLKTRKECGEDHLDAGASSAFALADHQIAHVYLNDVTQIGHVRELIESMEGVDRVISQNCEGKEGIKHPRAGDLLVIAKQNSWFSYHYWETPHSAPDFAKTVDIHRKPGYDPLELFIDPKLKFPKLKVATRLAQKYLGLRYLMDVIPLDNSLVRGSHGTPFADDDYWPVIMSSRPNLSIDSDRNQAISPLSIKDLILNHIFE